MDRRTALKSVGLTCALAGCLSPGQVSRKRRNTMNCKKSIIQNSTEDVQYYKDQFGDMELQKNGEYFKIGDLFEARLRVKSDAESYRTESRELYDIQKKGDSGWNSIFCLTGDRKWNRGVVTHDIESGFDWTFELRADALSDLRDSITVQEPLQSGQYRFVYFGVIEPKLDQENGDSEVAITTEFKLEGSNSTRENVSYRGTPE